jgi:hypothetical protein
MSAVKQKHQVAFEFSPEHRGSLLWIAHILPLSRDSLPINAALVEYFTNMRTPNVAIRSIVKPTLHLLITEPYL